MYILREIIPLKMMISIPIFINVILILVQTGGAISESGVSEELHDYLKNFKAELERIYEAKLEVIRGEFKDELKALKDDFDIKENAYKSRIELLERKIGSSYVPQGEMKDGIPFNKSGRLVIHANGDELKSDKHPNVFGSKIRRSKSGINRRQVSPDAENRVAFFASVSKEVRHMGANQDIIFDKIVTNLGSAYNGHHGTFIAPAAGTYVFFTTLHAAGDGSWGHFMVNGVIVAKIHSKGVQSSQTVIAHLNKGDDVSIQNSALDKGLHGDMYSTFGGFLLFEDTGFGTEIIGK